MYGLLLVLHRQYKIKWLLASIGKPSLTKTKPKKYNNWVISSSSFLLAAVTKLNGSTIDTKARQVAIILASRV